MTDEAHRPRADDPAPPEEAELIMRSEPLDTDDGEQVVIAQQNVGPGNEVGGGEFPTVHPPTSAEDAAREQAELDEEYERAHRTQTTDTDGNAK